MRIGIFGGAFNPVHKEHINLALAAVEGLKLDKLIVMPGAVSPHKSGRLTATDSQRLAMCKAAFKGVPRAEVSDWEISRGGVSYTYITCGHFAEKYENAERYLIVGEDMLASFPGWKNPRQILSSFKIAACARRGDNADFPAALSALKESLDAEAAVIPYVGEKVSSTKVRTLAALKEDFSAYVNKEICQYIKDNAVYELKNLSPVRGMLTKKRWEHTVRVAVMCAQNAPRIGLEEEKAITMAALHDCAKYLEKDSEYLKGFSFPEGVPGPVMHQFTGAYVAEHTFGVTDETILDAIRYHTTGRENMTEAGALLFLCDMLESGRDFDGVDELRRLFYKDLRLCLKESLRHQVEYLLSTGAPVDDLTLRAYEYCMKNY